MKKKFIASFQNYKQLLGCISLILVACISIGSITILAYSIDSDMIESEVGYESEDEIEMPDRPFTGTAEAAKKYQLPTTIRYDNGLEVGVDKDGYITSIGFPFCKDDTKTIAEHLAFMEDFMAPFFEEFPGTKEIEMEAADITSDRTIKTSKLVTMVKDAQQKDHRVAIIFVYKYHANDKTKVTETQLNECLKNSFLDAQEFFSQQNLSYFKQDNATKIIMEDFNRIAKRHATDNYWVSFEKDPYDWYNCLYIDLPEKEGTWNDIFDFC
ncbi:hypothetical protein [Candidatus Soleaferrea massiliensis]|uniref:hypothetical protein n=1 Tax=Candidatus Soleaferrea massiliensis TaxID=1470354 RepID=UPI00058BA992|nr:hypothetical protein [Candidatus Soleaferrea massiliensis]